MFRCGSRIGELKFVNSSNRNNLNRTPNKPPNQPVIPLPLPPVRDPPRSNPKVSDRRFRPKFLSPKSSVPLPWNPNYLRIHRETTEMPTSLSFAPVQKLHKPQLRAAPNRPRRRPFGLRQAAFPEFRRIRPTLPACSSILAVSPRLIPWLQRQLSRVSTWITTVPIRVKAITPEELISLPTQPKPQWSVPQILGMDRLSPGNISENSNQSFRLFISKRNCTVDCLPTDKIRRMKNWIIILMIWVQYRGCWTLFLWCNAKEYFIPQYKIIQYLLKMSVNIL